jgi:hypothetical protein
MGTHNSAAKREMLAETYGWHCYWCNYVLNQPARDGSPLHPSDATLDHYIPRSFNGSNMLGNLVLACSECNSARRHLLPSLIDRTQLREWIKVYGRLQAWRMIWAPHISGTEPEVLAVKQKRGRRNNCLSIILRTVHEQIDNQIDHNEIAEWLQTQDLNPQQLEYICTTVLTLESS